MRLARPLVLVFGLTAFVSSADAQSRADFIYLQDRVQRLEAQMGAGLQGGSAIAPQTEAQLSLRIGQLEEQVRVLTGQVEEARFKAQQLEEQLRRFQEDTEFRFRDLEGGGITAIPDNTPPTGQNPIGQQLSQQPVPGEQVLGQTPPAPTPQILGQLTVEAPSAPADDLSGRPLDLSALAGSLSQPNPLEGQAPGLAGQELAVAVPVDPRAEFELGYSLIITQDYIGAEGIFREFIDSYPENALVPDAYYWIGESQFQRAAFRDAADTYLAIYNRYPSTPQAAPSLLRLAQSLDRLGQRQAACTTLGELQAKYGATVPTVAERANQDARQWGC